MKTIKYIQKSLLVLAVGSVLACSDFLDVESPSSFDSDYVFSNTAEAKRVLLGAYALFTEDPYTSRMCNHFNQNTDVEANGVSANPDGSRRDVWSLQGDLLSSFGDIKKAWDNNYLAIERANQVIEGIQASSIAANPEMQMMLGEAYCLRAYRYFLLTNYWGDVPYYREAAKAGLQLDLPRTDKNVIYSGMIQDLVHAESNMFFADEFSDGIERMNREWCLGLITRLSLFRAGYGMTYDGTMKRADDYLDVATNDSLAVTYTLNGVTKTARTYTEYYQLAKDYAEYLIALKDRALNPDFQEVFDNQSRWIKPVNAEVLYEVAFGNTNSGGDVGWCIGVSVQASSYGAGTSYVRFPATYVYSFDEKDKRFETTVSMIEYKWDDDQIAASFNNSSPGKWSRLKLPQSPGSGSSKSTGINWPLMRYSDVLLMLAEAENELNGPTSLAKAQLNRVRARAFDAADHASKVTAYVDSVAASKADFFNALVDERAWEFGGECLRKFDLVRWNLYGEKVHQTRTALDNMGKAANDLDLANPDVAKYKHYARKLYYTKRNGVVEFLNTRWELPAAEVPSTTVDAENLSNDGSDYAQVGWCSNAYKKVTNTTTGEITYEPADYTMRTWRGYPESDYLAGKPVGYLLAIGAATVATSDYLTNDGYRLND